MSPTSGSLVAVETGIDSESCGIVLEVSEAITRDSSGADGDPILRWSLVTVPRVS